MAHIDESRNESNFCIISDIGTIVIMLCILFQNPAGHMSKYVKYLVLFTMICIILNRILAGIQKYLCYQYLCVHLEGIAIVLYAFSRTFISLFYVDKAKSSQGLEPVFPDRYFTRTFPVLIVGIFMMLLIWVVITWFMNSDTSWTCDFHQSDLFSFESCHSKELHEGNAQSNYLVLSIVVIVELGTTLFFTYLYLKPLRHIWHHIDAKHQRLKQLILFNVALTMLGMLSSNVTEICFFTGYGTNHWFRFDAVINVYTIYLLVRKKRSYPRGCCILPMVEVDIQEPEPVEPAVVEVTITPSVIQTAVKNQSDTASSIATDTMIVNAS